MPSTHQPEYLILGEVLRPHGIRGEIRVRLLTDYPERIEEVGFIYLGTSPESGNITRHEVQHMRMHKGYGLLKLRDIPDRNAAEQLRGLQVLVQIEDAVPLEEDEIYLFQLINMNVNLEDGSNLGIVTDVIETGANDVYVVQSPHYGEVLIPITESTLLNTDPDNNTITIKLPDGLLSQE